jgi:16S rRNA (cytidine1402-2'-O)-methyltransferase
MKPYPFYLVSTPIGNLEDLSARAAETLRSVDCVLAEDTRKARVLLDRLGIRAQVRSYHDYNERQMIPVIIREIKEGKRFALVADAGTPLVSDPGYPLVRRLAEEGIAVTAIPGPCAVTTALVLSGLPPDRFTFYGYVPRKPGERESLIREAASNPYTSVFYESPHRLLKTLEAFSRILGDREIVVARELTKLHEEVLRGTAERLLERFGETPPRGELTLLVRGLGRRRGGRAGAEDAAGPEDGAVQDRTD